MSKKAKSSAAPACGGHRRTRGASVKPASAGPGRPPAAEPLAASPDPIGASAGDTPVVSPPRRIEPRTHRELAQAIFAECGAVQVGRELLQSGSERGAAVRARIFETLANWQFGKPGQPSGAGNVRVIWDMPRPPRESDDTE